MATKQNIGVFTNPKHDLYVSEIETPDVGDLSEEEVLVHVRSTGICGSDVHFQKHGCIGPTMVVEDEHILGHESAGEVLAVGNKVKILKVGDKVALEPGVPCHTCKPCLTGKYNGCENVEFYSTPPVHGFLRRYIKHPAAFCHKINLLTYAQGALLEPLSVVFCGIRHINLILGQSVLVFGAGPIGFATAKAAEAAGAYPIMVTDIEQSKLDFIKKEIPSAITALVNGSLKENVAKVTDDGINNFDVAIECTGVEQSLELATHALDFGAKLHIIGVGKDHQKFPFMLLSVKEINITFQYRYANTWPTIIKLVEAGIIKLDNLVTHRFKLEDAVDAFKLAGNPKSGAMKILIEDS
ncbi:DEHA2E24332p [Debaryomyces hansenii CBS767]|uniref:L-arabinitol 4-dehydrogenase n=1 Tax=Debaryomyces hansenii (strain ATCC 36239 / CBS 767 / BCRC 21394 / JCM 1990 / NBRC 0083 / IGC 2968) TaxID=284592 RepID=Q6BN61_DEBHA|nr:DEHA2E24332p [Debaryomyces hansenii CBS767]CAG88650.1 DEHA2E24332p [Debaryomyces hansenii CBS767]|eukprot:XP_460359.1 DEHA2E24332p [Debaryomyces hansenii CBS767]